MATVWRSRTRRSPAQARARIRYEAWAGAVVFASLMMLAFLIQDTHPLDKGIGLFLMVLAAIALLVGAVLRMQESRSGSAPPTF